MASSVGWLFSMTVCNPIPYSLSYRGWNNKQLCQPAFQLRGGHGAFPARRYDQKIAGSFPGKFYFPGKRDRNNCSFPFISSSCLGPGSPQSLCDHEEKTEIMPCSHPDGVELLNQCQELPTFLCKRIRTLIKLCYVNCSLPGRLTASTKKDFQSLSNSTQD